MADSSSLLMDKVDTVFTSDLTRLICGSIIVSQASAQSWHASACKQYATRARLRIGGLGVWLPGGCSCCSGCGQKCAGRACNVSCVPQGALAQQCVLASVARGSLNMQGSGAA